MLYEMKSQNLYPLAIIFNAVNPILTQGAAHAGIAMLSWFDVDMAKEIPSGAKLRIEPKRHTVKVLESP